MQGGRELVKLGAYREKKSIRSMINLAKNHD